MMAYDYMNARVRAKKTELLSTDFFEQLLGQRDETLVVDALLNSPYGEALRMALSVATGFAALRSAVSRHVHGIFRLVLDLAEGDARRLVALQLGLWELHNVLTIVRGKVLGVGHGEIAAAVVPIGELGEVSLTALVEEPDLRAVLNSLSSWSYGYSVELRESFAGVTTSDALRDAELLLYETAFRSALHALASSDIHALFFREQVARQIDLLNVKRALCHARVHGGDFGQQPFEPIAGGNLSYGALLSISEAPELESAFELLDGTYFRDAVERGILAFGERGHLSAMERFLEEVVITEGCRYFRKDPLSAAVPLGYLWQQYNELLNLRILLRGMEHQVPPAAIREELLFV